MKNLFKAITLFLLLAMIPAATGCGIAKNLDVVGKESITSFNAVLKAFPDNITADNENGGWSFESPDSAVRFIWSKDYSKSPIHDVMLIFDAQPFIDAGLDTAKLPERVSFYEGKLTVGKKLGNDELQYKGDVTPLASYEQIVNNYRDTIGYHTALDHYGVSLGDGNMFEWAKDMNTNDKDLVFVLNPEPFIEAGADPEAIEGWVYAKVPVDVDGKPAEVYKLLKPFDLG